MKIGSSTPNISLYAELLAAMENLPMCVGVFTWDGQAIFMNRAFREFYHPHIEDPINHYQSMEEYIQLAAMADWATDPKVYLEKSRQQLLNQGWHRAQIEVRGRILDVHDVLVEDRLIITTQKDITDNILAERQMSFLARHDVLTGLANRAGLEAETERLQLGQGDNKPFSLLIADLDHFKPVNDLHGHAAGDAVLREIGRRFHECLDAGEFAARLGGDEFVFLTPETDVVVNAKALALRLRACVARPVDFEGLSLRIGVTIGYASYPGDGDDMASLTRAADQALYDAKTRRRGTVRRYKRAVPVDKPITTPAPQPA
jgi:diguanylate cyclase (GGDEF)-like protein